MIANWQPLEQELAKWAAAGLTLPFWWRDDDAIAPGPALTQLNDLAETHGIPVHLAVIPDAATQALADHVARHPRLLPVVHGWAHMNHAPAGEKKAEFGDHRPTREMLDQAAGALERLNDLFGPRLCPMFVPPWNRISPLVVAGLGEIGFALLSTFLPRPARMAGPGLVQVNTHLDPINWKGGRGLVDPDTLIAQLVQHLADRRTGRADNDEPYGLLTHHLVHDDEIWAFTDALLDHLCAGPVRKWSANDPTP